MARSSGLRQRWAGLVVTVAVVAGLATFTGGGAAATPPDPTVVTEGVLQLHLGADGNRFEIVHDITPYGEEWRRFGEYVQQQLGKLGIKVNLRYEDVPTWLRRVYTNYDYQLTNNWIQTLADPVIGVHRLYHSKMIKPGTVFVNETGWSSPETDALMDKATVEVDPKARSETYHQLQKQIVEASPIVYVMELDFITVYNKKLQNWLVSPLGLYSAFDQAWLAK